LEEKKNETCGIISGGAAMDAIQASEEGLDLYITGEAAHEMYHLHTGSGIECCMRGTLCHRSLGRSPSNE
jgi:putative NIF3 family GTP cyclohydrolase 1 type 2